MPVIFISLGRFDVETHDLIYCQGDVICQQDVKARINMPGFQTKPLTITIVSALAVMILESSHAI